MICKDDRVFKMLGGRSQYEVAQEIGVPQSNINVWLNGKRQPQFDSLQKLAKCLGYQPAELSLLLREIGKEKRQIKKSDSDKVSPPIKDFDETAKPLSIQATLVAEKKLNPNTVRFSIERDSGGITFYANLLSNKNLTLKEFIDLATSRYPKYINVSYEFDTCTSEHKVWLSK